MRGHTAAHGQNALRVLHALDIFGGSFQADENHFPALLAFNDGILRRKDDGAGSRARRRRDALADDVVFIRFLQSLRVERGVQQHVERLGVDLHERLFLGDHALVDQIAGDFDRRGRGALAVACLEHIELLILDGELHILHVAVMPFQSLADLLELRVDFGEYLRHLRDGHRRADACDDVFALRVDQEFAHQALLAGRGVPRERDARAGRIAQVAERHHLHVDRGAPAVGDVVIHAVDVCAGVVPRTEHRLDRAEELLFRIGGEILADLRLIFRFELGSEYRQVFRSQLDVLRDALFLLHLVDQSLEILFADLHHDVRIHLNESSVAVPRPSGVAGFLRQNFDHLIVQAEVQDGIHHARHGSARTRADGDQKGIFQIAELLAGDLLHLADVLHDLRLDLIVDFSAVLVILRAGLGGNGESLRNGKTDIGHLREVRALAAQDLTHFRVAFAEQIDVFFHLCFFLHRFLTSNILQHLPIFFNFFEAEKRSFFIPRQKVRRLRGD